jgi:hypothetical protein
MASSINIFHKIHTNYILRRTCVNYQYLYHAGSDPDQNLDPNKPLCTVSVVKILLMSFFKKSFGSRPNSGSESAIVYCTYLVKICLMLHFNKLRIQTSIRIRTYHTVLIFIERMRGVRDLARIQTEIWIRTNFGSGI